MKKEEMEKRLRVAGNTANTITNFFFRPWFSFIIIIGVIGSVSPYIYKEFLRSPTIEDCADFKYIQKNLNWSPDFLKLPASEKLIKQDWNNTGYEYQWSLCEVEKQKLPKFFNEKYKSARYRVEDSIKVQEEFLKLRQK